jgi:glutamyl-tRNA synthetase
LSKRHGDLGVDAYRELGYLPEALRNYLLRLGWSHGDDEIISTEQAIEWFDIDAVGRAPARFDFAKLDNLNGHYIRAADDESLVALVTSRLEKLVGKPLTGIDLGRLREAMPELKLRPKTLVELAANARFLVAPRPIRPDDKAAKLLTPDARRLLAELLERFDGVEWQAERLEDQVRAFADQKGTKLGSIAQPLRAALTGSLASPSIFVVMKILGREESLGRIADAAGSTG